jgi:hydroxypyruvate reductase
MGRFFKKEPKSIASLAERVDVMAIMDAALSAADPLQIAKSNLKLVETNLFIGDAEYDLDQLNRIRVVGMGKGSVPMAKALVEILGIRIERGIIVTKHSDAKSGRRIGTLEEIQAGHPVPDKRSVEAATKITRLAAELGEGDLLITLITGGASALVTKPAPGLSLQDIQTTNRVLLDSGASIQELNTVRKHLSSIKGGQLAQITAPARTVSLIISDVVGDNISMVGSGPTAPDETTFADAVKILESYHLMSKLPNRVRERLLGGRYGLIEETPKFGDPVFNLTNNMLVGSNRLVAEAAVARARELGYNSFVLTAQMEGEAREVGKNAARLAREISEKGEPVNKPACVVLGGETTVTIHGSGKGGRNQELALAAAMHLKGIPNVLVAALATDGGDGPTDCAGAVATGDTVFRGANQGIDPLKCLMENDAYHFFAPLDDLLFTGPTQTNVADILLIFVF